MQSNKCNHCNTVYAHRQSLWRHKQKCKDNRAEINEQDDRKLDDTEDDQNIRKRSTDVLTAQVDTISSEKKIANPRIQELMDEIVDDGVIFKKNDEPTVKKLRRTIMTGCQNEDNTEKCNAGDDNESDNDKESELDMEISD